MVHVLIHIAQSKLSHSLFYSELAALQGKFDNILVSIDFTNVTIFNFCNIQILSCFVSSDTNFFSDHSRAFSFVIVASKKHLLFSAQVLKLQGNFFFPV